MSSPKEMNDIVVTGHDDDIKFIKRLVESLQQAGFTVWYPEESSSSQTQRVSQAILGCKVYVPVLSELWAEDKLFNDELALAYISNSAIFPFGLKSFPQISQKLDGGSKLILARINWTILDDTSKYETCTKNLIKSIKQQLELINGRENSEDIGMSGYIETHGLVINTQFSNHSNEDNEDEPEDLNNPTPEESKEKTPPKPRLDFWDRHFKNKSEVQWTEFKDKFHQDYDNKILELFHEKEQKLFKNLMYRDIFNLNKSIQRGVYDRFCNKNPQGDPHCFYNRLQEYVIAHMSLRKVFNMNSTLRITTIQNLGQFSFPAIVKGLTEMLKDEDPNTRAVAAIALAKSGKSRSDTVDKLVGLLDDEDRLVRESALLSLGYLKAVKAVDHVVDRWRNDPISTVRDAASIALKRMNIEEAQKCIKVTEVLSQEMSALKPQ